MKTLHEAHIPAKTFSKRKQFINLMFLISVAMLLTIFIRAIVFAG